METFQHVHEQLDALLVADKRLLEAAALVQLHRPLQDGDGGCLHPRHMILCHGSVYPASLYSFYKANREFMLIYSQENHRKKRRQVRHKNNSRRNLIVK